jgi:putative peptidoglycan lipid II flippase
MWGFVAGTGLAALWNLTARPAAVPVVATQSSDREPMSAPSASRWIMAVFLIDAIAQTFSLIDRHFGSYLPAGSIAALQYANQIAFIPFSVLGMGLSTAIFPYLSEAVAANDGTRTVAILDRAVRWSLLSVVPMAVWMIVFRQEVVTLLLERGAFNAASRQLTATALAAFSAGLVPSVLSALWSRVFYSSRQWRPILYSSLAGFSVKALCGWWWVQSAGIAGLAAATAMAHCVWMLPLFWILRAAVPTERFLAWGAYGVRVLLLTAVPAVLVSWFAPMVLPGGSLSAHATAIVRFAGGASASIVCLLLVGPHWRIGEAGTVIPGMVRAVHSLGGDSRRGA